MSSRRFWKYCLAVALLASSLLLKAEVSFGVDSVGADFFRIWYGQGDLVHYLDNFSDFAVYQSETTGRWNLPDRMLVSIAGNSYAQTRHYWNGHRMDSRFNLGSPMFQLNMQHHDLALDYHRGELHYRSVVDSVSYVRMTGNGGGLGGITPGTKELINLFHTTASERALKPIEERSHMPWSTQVEVNSGIRKGDEWLPLHCYAQLGSRSIAAFDHQGIYGSYEAPFSAFQIDGQLALDMTDFVDEAHYAVRLANRSDYGSELGYNSDETARLASVSAAVFGERYRDENCDLRFGLLFESNRVEHNNLQFSRNLVDQDGEGFEPWYPDGDTREFTLSLDCDYHLNSWLDWHAETFNSILSFNPSRRTWENTVYLQRYGDATAVDLYRYHWTSSAFIGALLDNLMELRGKGDLNDWTQWRASAGFSSDGIWLAGGKSVFSPNWQVSGYLSAHPWHFLRTEISLSRHRMNFNSEQMFFLSEEYMNGVLQYASDGQFLSGSGGQYHRAAEDLRQPSYLVFDLPVWLTFGRHEISLLQSYRKYSHLWTVAYQPDKLSQIGMYQDGIYYLYGQKAYYMVQNQSAECFGDSWLTNSPYAVSSHVKYTYRGEKLLASVSWQSHLMSGLAALGNGVTSNNIGVLSESSANPNTYLNPSNADSRYRALGRMDQDRAYICRILLSYRMNDRLTWVFNGKFKDGTPFTNYRVSTYTFPGANHTQAAVYRADTRGINPADGHFGKRKDAFFNVDLRAVYRGEMKNYLYEVEACCYNACDFGTELYEYCFDQDIPNARRSMALCIPRGVLLSFKLIWPSVQ